MTTPNLDTLSEQLLRHEAFVRRLARSLVGDSSAAEDVAQDALVLALERGSPPVGLRSWLAGTVRRLARHRWRSESRRRWREAAAARPESLPVQEPLEEANRVVRLVLALDEPFRETAILTHHHGLRPAEIARRQGVPAATVRSRLHRAHEKLRVALCGDRDGDERAWVLALAPFTEPPRAPATASTGALWARVLPSWRVVHLSSALVGGGVLTLVGLSVWLGRSAPLEQTAAAVVPSRASLTPIPPGARETAGFLAAERETVPSRVPLLPAVPAVARPDHPYWKAVREARASGERFNLERIESPANQRLRQTVETATLPPFSILSEESLTVAVSRIATLTGVPASVTRAAEDAAIDTGVLYDLELRQPHSLTAVLDLLVFLTYREIAWTIADGELRLCARREFDQRYVEFRHNIADFALEPREFFRPEEALHPVFESPYGLDDLATQIMEFASVGTWEDPGATLDMSQEGLVIRHSPRVQLEVQRSLDGLRSFLIPLPEKGVPGRRSLLGASGEHRRIAQFLVETTTGQLVGTGDGEIGFATVLQRAATKGRFDLVFHDGVEANPRILPASDVGVAQELDRLRRSDVRWTVYREFVVLWPGNELEAERTFLFRDLRELLAAEEIPAELLTGHPVLERRAASGEGSLSPGPDELDSLIRDHVDPESWDDDPSNSLRINHLGVLQLFQSPAVVAEIEGLLDRLEEIVRKTESPTGRQ